MARYALIDGYLDTMRSSIRWRLDLDDLVSEMEDHLYTAVENLVSTGAEPDAAQRTTLKRFGEPKLLTAVYASTDNGGLAVPTKFTKRAGTFARISASLWLATAVLYTLMVVFDNQWQVYYALFSAAVLAAGVFGLLTMIGVNKRLGGLGVPGMIGMSVVGLGVAVSVIAWAVPAWMIVQGVGYLVFGGAVLNRGIAPQRSTLLVSSGLIIGAITFVLLNLAEVGWRDSYGDYPLAWALGVVAATIFLPLGLFGWSNWLRKEEPVDIDSDEMAITA